MGKFIGVLFLATAIGAVVAWQFELFPAIPSLDQYRPKFVGYGEKDAKPAPTVELGHSLYGANVPFRELPANLRTGDDPVVIYGNLTAIERMDAGAQVPGQVLFVGQQIPEGASQVGGVAAFLQSKIYYATISQGGADVYTLYHRLSEGQTVGNDDMVAMIDPSKALHGLREALAKQKAATAEYEAAEKIDNEAERRLRVEMQLGKLSSELELSNAKLTRVKTYQEYIQKREAVALAGIELDKAEMLLKLHQIRNKLPVKSSILKTIYKPRGEAVKELEPVVQLYALDRLTAEGLVEMQYASRLALNRKVAIEPTREISPKRVWRAHKKEITAVAVTSMGQAASASEDGTVCLWRENYAGPEFLLRHGAPVRSLACSPAGSAIHWVVAGLADGSIAIWDLTHLKDKVAPQALKIMKGHHNDAVTALAFSPDGKYFASGSTDGAIALWSPESSNQNEDLKYLYFPFDQAHGVENPHSGQVTSLHFTPQGRLVSAARDNTLRVWQLHEKGAHLVSEPIAGRSGNISQLGVSRDGSFMLFDQGKTLQILSHDGRTFSTLQNPAGVVPFETLAVFSTEKETLPSLLLTAGAAEGRLQLWKTPTDGNRSFEVGQLVTSERAAVTSAAFFDTNEKGERFAVSGTKDGIVYLWTLPSRADVELHRIDNVRLTQISQNVETRQVRIGVEVPNRDGRLIPGQPVTIVIE